MLVCLIVLSLVYIFIPWIAAQSNYIKSGFNYKVEGIEFRDGHRGVPHIKVDTGWYLLRSNQELQMVPYIREGDSVVKRPGENLIRVFRKTTDGVIVKEFD